MVLLHVRKTVEPIAVEEAQAERGRCGFSGYVVSGKSLDLLCFSFHLKYETTIEGTI